MSKRRKFKDPEWVGKRFWKLTVLSPVHIVKDNGNKEWHWLMKCDCGTEKVMSPSNVINGISKSCGCEARRIIIERSTKHGEAGAGDKKSRLYRIYYGMRARCYNENFPKYKNYGARGITICDEWKNDFVAFATWARNNGYADDLTIDRIDVNKGYSPENCRWVTNKVQSLNKTNTVKVEFQGDESPLLTVCENTGADIRLVRSRLARGYSLEDAITPVDHSVQSLRSRAIAAGMNPGTVENRVIRGWNEEEAINTPLLKSGKNYKAQYGKSIAEMAREANISPEMVYMRVNRYGWSVEDALSTPPMKFGDNRKKLKNRNP